VALARLFHVSTSWIRRLLQRLRQTGSFAALAPSGGAPPKLTPQHEQRLIEAVRRHPDATLAQLRRACGRPGNARRRRAAPAKAGAAAKKN
jgi:transposase